MKNRTQILKGYCNSHKKSSQYEMKRHGVCRIVWSIVLFFFQSQSIGQDMNDFLVSVVSLILSSFRLMGRISPNLGMLNDNTSFI